MIVMTTIKMVAMMGETPLLVNLRIILMVIKAPHLILVCPSLARD
jgi:hypothetical protein